MSNHTPGPWLAREGDVFNPERPWGVVHLLSPEECEAVDGDQSLYGERTVVIAEVMSADKPEIAEADAKLMAAAPALLAALRDIAKGQNTSSDGLRWMAVKAAHRAGVGLYPQTCRVIHRGSGTIEDWTLDRILTEINDALIELDDHAPIVATDPWAECLREYTEWQLIDDPN